MTLLYEITKPLEKHLPQKTHKGVTTIAIILLLECALTGLMGVIL